MKVLRSMEQFCKDVVDLLNSHGIEYLLGGYYALHCYHPGVERDTKDLDLLVRPSDVDRLLEICRAAGYKAEKTFDHWLAKVWRGRQFIDIIFNSGNGLCRVDDTWFKNSRTCVVLDRAVKIAPPEEIIWQKAYIMERERFDGADVAHLLLYCANHIDWEHLVRRFEPDWRVLLSHFVLFGFIYPSKRGIIPKTVLDDLIERLKKEGSNPPADSNLCNGTLLSRNQYLFDTTSGDYQDARLSDRCDMSQKQVQTWTLAGEIQQSARQKSAR